MQPLRASKSIHSGEGRRWLLLGSHETRDIHLGRGDIKDHLEGFVTENLPWRSSPHLAAVCLTYLAQH